MESNVNRLKFIFSLLFSLGQLLSISKLHILLSNSQSFSISMRSSSLIWDSQWQSESLSRRYQQLWMLQMMLPSLRSQGASNQKSLGQNFWCMTNWSDQAEGWGFQIWRRICWGGFHSLNSMSLNSTHTLSHTWPKCNDWGSSVPVGRLNHYGTGEQKSID